MAGTKTDWMLQTWKGMAEYLGYQTEKEMLEGLYAELGTIKAVAKKLNYCRACVRHHFKMCGVETLLYPKKGKYGPRTKRPES